MDLLATCMYLYIMIVQESVRQGSFYSKDSSLLRRKRAGMINCIASSYYAYSLMANEWWCFYTYTYICTRYTVDQDLNTCTVAIVADYEFFSNVGNGLESTVSSAFNHAIYSHYSLSLSLSLSLFLSLMHTHSLSPSLCIIPSFYRR